MINHVAVAMMDIELKETVCPLWQDKDPLQMDSQQPIAWTSAKDFYADRFHQKPLPRCLKGPIQHEDDLWINWYYSPRAGLIRVGKAC